MQSPECSLIPIFHGASPHAPPEVFRTFAAASKVRSAHHSVRVVPRQPFPFVTLQAPPPERPPRQHLPREDRIGLPLPPQLLVHARPALHERLPETASTLPLHRSPRPGRCVPVSSRAHRQEERLEVEAGIQPAQHRSQPSVADRVLRAPQGLQRRQRPQRSSQRGRACLAKAVAHDVELGQRWVVRQTRRQAGHALVSDGAAVRAQGNELRPASLQ
mmetsp:Transcript_7075/g.16527  ORF Transcript_7075/g.16527 Transcript_7075/m.16527 type:complete len:217 (+) Transcript_7075:297-947(+)